MTGLVKIFLLFVVTLAVYTYAGAILSLAFTVAAAAFCLMGVLMVTAMIMVGKWWFDTITANKVSSAPAELGQANTGLYSEEGSWTSVG